MTSSDVPINGEYVLEILILYDFLNILFFGCNFEIFCAHLKF